MAISTLRKFRKTSQGMYHAVATTVCGGKLIENAERRVLAPAGSELISGLLHVALVRFVADKIG